MPRKIYWEIFFQRLAYYIGSVVLVLSIIALTSFHLAFRLNNYWVLIGFGIISGIMFGLVWSNMIAPYGKEITISLPIKNKCELINIIDTTLRRMNYHLESSNNNVLIYSSSKSMEYFIGKMSIHLHGASVTIVGSTKHVRKIWKQLKAA
jgi:hypothetical protein